MAERQPIPSPEPQRTPHEGGNGSPGLPRTVQESAKPPPDSSAHGGSERTSRQAEEMRSRYENRYLEELRTLSETDPALFATRAMGALEELLKARVPHAEREKERDVEESRAYFQYAGYTFEPLLPYGRLLHYSSRNSQNHGYVQGLEATFSFLHDRITGQNKWPRLPVERVQQDQSQKGEGNPKT